MSCHYAAVVDGFEGTCRFEVAEHGYECDGEAFRSHSVSVVLDGRDASTGERVRYESAQTGF